MAGLSDAAIAGVYVSEQGKLADREQPELWWECVEGALADAGLGLGDLDGLIGPAPDGYGVRHALPASAVADVVGHPLRFHANTGVGAASQAAGVGLAALAVANGLAEVVVIPTAAAGSGAGYTAADRNAAVEHMAKLGSPFEAVMGTTRVADFAMVAQRHMHEYGTTSEQLAEVAVAQRHSATLHPRAVMRDRGELTVDEVLASRLMAEPLHLLDCCLVNQGGGCVVVTRRDRATDAGLHAPVVLLGWGEGHGYLDPNTAPELTAFSGRLAADTAFGLAGVTRDDIQVAGVSDHFTISVITELEDAGFCAKGEGRSVRRRRWHRARWAPPHQHARRVPVGHARRELRAVHAHRAGRAAARRGGAPPGRRRRARVPLRRRWRVAGALRGRARELRSMRRRI